MSFTLDDMEVSNTKRIVILGKTGAGKSSLANTIFGEELFTINHSLNSETRECQAQTKCVNGRNITLIDTPGFFDTDRPEEELKAEIVKCIIECAPGPHAFLIVFKLEKFTQQEKDVIEKIRQYFSEEAFEYATVVFTHGDQLHQGQTIKESVDQNKFMRDLVKKCGGRCHVIDNKYWNESPKDEYRNNQFQVEELLKTIDKPVLPNKRSCYTNEMLQRVQEEITVEERCIRTSSGNMSEEEITQQARVNVFEKLLIKAAGIATGALLGALCGVGVIVRVVYLILKVSSDFQLARDALKTVGVAAARAAGIRVGTSTGAENTTTGTSTGGENTTTGTSTGGEENTTTGGTVGAAGITVTLLGKVTVVAAAGGAVIGGCKGYNAAEGADTAWEAAKRAAGAVKEETISVFDNINGAVNRLSR
ncbi:GTPase IMAP family member 7-like [Lates calcarifer]|uniref:GTPase IMAP family member 7-like n=1 Tax=Lates calcarifer TaxID=8187 RepID=A0AAJ7Q0D6_LATCA|nr:GTPase IMAP family member 7-like [Lates calcarifer]